MDRRSFLKVIAIATGGWSLKPFIPENPLVWTSSKPLGAEVGGYLVPKRFVKQLLISKELIGDALLNPNEWVSGHIEWTEELDE